MVAVTPLGPNCKPEVCKDITTKGKDPRCLHPSVTNSSHRDVFAAELVNALKSMHISGGGHKDQSSPCMRTYPDSHMLTTDTHLPSLGFISYLSSEDDMWRFN